MRDLGARPERRISIDERSAGKDARPGELAGRDLGPDIAASYGAELRARMVTPLLFARQFSSSIVPAVEGSASVGSRPSCARAADGVARAVVSRLQAQVTLRPFGPAQAPHDRDSSNFVSTKARTVGSMEVDASLSCAMT